LLRRWRGREDSFCCIRLVILDTLRGWKREAGPSSQKLF
jgi:hypothetical protein